ncbi:MAG: hypothetical protein EAZ07_08810 [Cytophagales bacterium]|nr:MAG: hypothetical protein EAZ07_08810 [Cytophagales bacterium]
MKITIRKPFSAFKFLVISITFCLIVLISIIIYSYLGTQKLYNDFKWVQHTYQVQSRLENLTTLVSESESAKRGFLITGQQDFFNLFIKIKKEIITEIAFVQHLKKDDEPQMEKILKLEQLIIKRLEIVDSLLLLKLNNETAYKERHIEIINLGKDYMNQIKILNNDITKEEEKLLRQREEMAYDDLRTTDLAIIISGFLSLLTVGLAIFVLKKDINRQNNINKELRMLDSQKNKFFSIISHDLRNPINAVKQLSGFLKAEHISEAEVKTISKLIDESIIKISNLLEDLLKWGKLQMNKIEFKIEKFDISILLQECIGNLISNAHLKNITIDFQTQPNTFVQADQNMIQTVIRNILSNAIKFTHKGGLIVIKIEKKQNEIQILFNDNGIGMTNETMMKLFRIDSTQSMIGTDNETGTGLGLILCKEFIEKNGGQITIDSIINQGTKIYITIPSA